AFDIVVPLATPFIYDPAQGNLLLDIRNSSGSSASLVSGSAIGGDTVSRVLGSLSGSTGTPDTGGDSLQICFTNAFSIPTHTLALISQSSKQEGSTLAVPMALISSGDVGGMTFVLRYDANYLRNPELLWSPSLAGLFNSVNYANPGEIHVTFALSGDA